jgi:hypothetical protein
MKTIKDERRPSLDATQQFLAKYRGKKISFQLTADDVQRRNQMLREWAIKDGKAYQRIRREGRRFAA